MAGEVQETSPTVGGFFKHLGHASQTIPARNLPPDEATASRAMAAFDLTHYGHV